jgi:site-specific recombinase XerD
MKKISKLSDRTVFWEIAAEYLNHYLPDIRRMSSNTVFTYRTSLNCYIDYLETEKGKERQQISFQDFGKDNLSDYFIWMSGVKNLSPKTCC